MFYIRKNVINLSEYSLEIMLDNYIYRTYKTKGNALMLREKLTGALLEKGFIRAANSGKVIFFRYPSIVFFSKKPLTFISRLDIDITEKNSISLVKAGVTFTKIKYYTIFIMFLICVILPMTLGIILHGEFDIPPMAYMGIPVGFMMYYHVRGRAFRALDRLIKGIGEY